METPTPTQAVFLCCLLIFGPAFGFIAVHRHIESRMGGWWSFLFASFAAYSGWLVSGLIAFIRFPDYGNGLKGDITEPMALLFTVPGFITGWIGLVLLRKFANRDPQGKGLPGPPRNGD